MKAQKLKPVSTQKFESYFLQYKRNKNIPDPQKMFEPLISHIQQLAIGPYYWNIGCVPDVKIVATGGDIETLTPYKKEQWLGASPEFAFSHIYPGDMAYCLAYVMKLDQYLKKTLPEDRLHVKASVYARFKNKAGKYYWGCIQYPGFLYDENDNLLYVLSLCSDISHIKSGQQNPFMSILNTSSAKHRLYTCHRPEDEIVLQTAVPAVTERERQILKLLSQGKSSKQIADELFIAKNTVDNRRQNLLRKFAVSSSAELVNTAAQKGLL